MGNSHNPIFETPSRIDPEMKDPVPGGMSPDHIGATSDVGKPILWSRRASSTDLKESDYQSTNSCNLIPHETINYASRRSGAELSQQPGR